ncbi:sensor histidine kinase [Nonomuraea guangzhouensis]|uniref:histidine kinase n=1 Tax=Nonomuraea guangzhouensis TaxID=1291555 RepID=A0ABW4GNH9_9ACTN|nr:sensor histidine kinase [Nonomuraea guangzhouensis]
MRFMRRITAAWRFFKRPRVFDSTLVAVLVIGASIGLYSTWRDGYPDVAKGAGLFIICTFPLLLRRNRPITVAAIETVADVFGMTADILPSNSLTSMIAFYSVGRYTPGRTAALTAAGVSVVYGVATALTRPLAGSWIGGMIYPLIIVGIGQFVRMRAELRERGQREAAESAVRAERRRIARELHDVVAHHISVINVLVGGARATLPPSEDVALDALAGAERTARQALAEMRQLLYVLRADDPVRTGGVLTTDGLVRVEGGADAATGVGAARLPALVQEAETAGLPASLTVTGEPVTLPAAVDHAVYRIVQEALTNTRKHAAGARASVRLAYEGEAVEVEVIDDGLPTPGGRTAAAPGFGLDGMAERVALCGGLLRTGPRLEGGFVVHARIPLERT